MTLQLLGGLTVPQFLSRHWQKKPLLVRQAISGFSGTVQTSEIFRLATRDDVESRLIRGNGARRSLVHGPFRASEIRSLPRKHWTILVQGLNLHHEGTEELLRRFSFIPYARLDDVMVSYAAPGGGVGPHQDSYDVFLLQGKGRRLWRIGIPEKPQFVRNSDLRILSNFRHSDEFTLDAGDMLYLPPGWGHDGIALDECTTYSMGFRAPANRELLSEFLSRMSEKVDVKGHYEDPDLIAQKNPAEIPKAMLNRTVRMVSRMRHSHDDIQAFLGEYLSEPKPNILFERPEKPLPRSQFAKLLHSRTVRSDPRTLMLYSGRRLFVNGESAAMSSTLEKSLMKLANERHLAPGRHAKELCALLHQWYLAGWLHLQTAKPILPSKGKGR